MPSKNTNPEEIYDYEGFPVGRARDVPLRFSLNTGPTLQVQPGEVNVEFKTIAFSASFGGDPFSQVRFVSGVEKGVGSRLVRVPDNHLGCGPYKSETGSVHLLDAVVLVHRGLCTFLEKLVHATRAGARGVVVMSDNDLPLNPSAELFELEEYAGDKLEEAVLVAVTRSAGEEISRLLDATEKDDDTDVLITVDPEGQAAKTDTQPSNDSSSKENTKGPITRVLYLNGHPLLNTILLI